MQFKRSLSDRIKSCSIYIFESTAYVHLEIEPIRREILHNYQAIEKQYFIKQNCQSYETFSKLLNLQGLCSISLSADF